MSNVPGVVNDGDFSKAQQDGSPEYSFPFAERGDNKTFVAKVTFRVDVNSYRPPIAMSQRMFPGLGRGYMLDFDQPQMVGQQLLSYGVYFGNVPQRSEVNGSTTYGVQKPIAAQEYGQNASIVQYNDTFDALIVYEYSLWQPLTQLFYARYMLAPFSLAPDNYDALYIAGSTGYVGNTPDGMALFLAQNSTSKLYRGRIFERMSIYAKINLAASYPRIAIIPPPAPP